jgi:hypothetical protein
VRHRSTAVPDLIAFLGTIDATTDVPAADRPGDPT